MPTIDKPLQCMYACVPLHEMLLQVVKLEFEWIETELDSDFIYVYDGANDSAPLIAKLHGSPCTDRGSYSSTQSDMFVVFTSDGSVNDGGFVANYASVTYGLLGQYR